MHSITQGRNIEIRNLYQSDGRETNGSLSILRPDVNYQLWHAKYPSFFNVCLALDAGYSLNAHIIVFPQKSSFAAV